MSSSINWGTYIKLLLRVKPIIFLINGVSREYDEDSVDFWCIIRKFYNVETGTKFKISTLTII